MSKLILKITQSKFTDFVSKLQDLAGIDDIIKIKIGNDHIMMYSMISNESAVLALKNYVIPTNEYIENFNQDETYDFIITSASKFVKNLKFFNTDVPIKLEFVSKPLPDNKEVMHVRSAQFSNGKLKISCIGGEEFKIRDMNKSMLESRLDSKNCRWGFKISQQDFSDVKKLCSINNEEKILNINVINNSVTLSESSKWELEVDNIDIKNVNLIFGKKYLSNINTNDEFVNFSIFDTFILIKDINSDLLLSFEQSFDED